MKFWLGVTDTNWYHFLRDRNPEDVNFWQPSGHHQNFKAIDKGAPFLFKLKSPYNAIGGVGFFSVQAFLPLSVAWDAFGERNGYASYTDFKKSIDQYRYKSGNNLEPNPVIGCLALTNPVFFDDSDWIPAPENWSNSIVVGKGYDDNEEVGARLWDQVQIRLERKNFFKSASSSIQTQLTVNSGNDGSPRYRENILSRVRLGQGVFRVLITQAYQGQCAITGEHTLPVLEAAHIKPFSESGPNTVANGLLLRSDLHKLFDSGYITITPDYRMEVSTRLKDEFHNGKIYYEMAGRKLVVTPSEVNDMPNKEFLQWHNETVFRAS
jgi:putative restriction endonuclease